MSNQQPTSPLDRQPDGSLAVHHIFPTIQGEGPFAGTPAIFVRLYGCNLQCPACDTDYTSKQQQIQVTDLLFDILDATPMGWLKQSRPKPLIVITGGEPFRQNLVPLVQRAIESGYRVQIETNGTLWNPDMAALCGLYPQELTIVCSPKTGRLHDGILKHAKHFKYVVQSGHVTQSDGLPSDTMMKEGSVARPPAGATVYVQPLDETMLHDHNIGSDDANAANLTACKLSAMRHGYNLSVQTHKIANLE